MTTALRRFLILPILAAIAQLDDLQRGRQDDNRSHTVKTLKRETMSKKKTRRLKRKGEPARRRKIDRLFGITPAVKRVTVKQLRRQREKSGRSLRETAKLLGISIGFYSMIEIGQRRPGLTVACRIAKHYGYTVEQIWGKVGK